MTGMKRSKGHPMIRGPGGTGARAKKNGWPMQQRPGCWVWLADQVVVIAVSKSHQIGISGVISPSATAGKACRYSQKGKKAIYELVSVSLLCMLSQLALTPATLIGVG